MADLTGQAKEAASGRTQQEITLTVAQQSDCPLFRKGDKMVIRLPGIDTVSGSVCAYAVAQALPFLAAAQRAGQPVEEVLAHMRCISGGEHFAEFTVESAPLIETVETKAARALRQVDYLADLDGLEMEMVVARLQTDQYFPGSLLLQQGQPADRLVLVTRGSAEIVAQTPDGFERILGRVAEGDACGGEDLPGAALLESSLRCLTIVQASVLLRSDLVALMAAEPEIAQHLEKFGFKHT